MQKYKEMCHCPNNYEPNCIRQMFCWESNIFRKLKFEYKLEFPMLFQIFFSCQLAVEEAGG